MDITKDVIAAVEANQLSLQASSTTQRPVVAALPTLNDILSGTTIRALNTLLNRATDKPNDGTERPTSNERVTERNIEVPTERNTEAPTEKDIEGTTQGRQSITIEKDSDTMVRYEN